MVCTAATNSARFPVFQIAVGSQFVAAIDIAAGLGGCENDDWDLGQRGIALDVGQHLAAILARQVEVENNQVGDRRFTRISFMPQKRNCLYSIVDRVT